MFTPKVADVQYTRPNQFALGASARTSELNLMQPSTLENVRLSSLLKYVPASVPDSECSLMPHAPEALKFLTVTSSTSHCCAASMSIPIVPLAVPESVKPRRTTPFVRAVGVAGAIPAPDPE